MREARSGRRRPRTAPDFSMESDVTQNGTAEIQHRGGVATRVTRTSGTGASGGSGVVGGGSAPLPEVRAEYVVRPVQRFHYLLLYCTAVLLCAGLAL